MDKQLLFSTSRPHLWTKKFLIILSINVLIYFGWQVQMSTLPIYIKNLSNSDSIVGLCSALGSVAALIIRPFAGFAIDRIGRRTLFIIGISLMVTAALFYQWMPFLAAALVIRFIFGLGWGISTTSSSTMAVDIIPKERFGEGMGYFTLAQSFPLAIAPAVGLYMMKTINFYGITNLAAVLIFIALLICISQRNINTDKKRKLKFVFYEKSAVKPSIFIIFVSAGLSGLFGFASLYGSSKGYADVGLFFTLFAVSLLVIRPLTGKVIDRYGFNIIIFSGFAGFIISMLLPLVTNSEIGFLAAAVLQGLSYGSLYTGIQAMAIINSPEDRRGMANATFYNGFDFGTFIGNIIAGSLAGIFGYSIMFALMAIPLLVGVILYLIIGKGIRIERNKKLNVEVDVI